MFSDSEAEDEMETTRDNHQEKLSGHENKKRCAEADGAEQAANKRRSEIKSRSLVPPDRTKSVDSLREPGVVQPVVSPANKSVLNRIKRSYHDPRLDIRSNATEETSKTPRRPATTSGDHWTAKSASVARRRGNELRANPSGLDGRAAYERPSMHGREMVISVGPSSLPRACRVTKSRIPSADARW